KVPAEVSKRGVMIDVLRELSPAGERESTLLYQTRQTMQAKNTRKSTFFSRRAIRPQPVVAGGSSGLRVLAMENASGVREMG
ncbi:MAG TPA: hypothetical protein VEG35_05340, partial [Burkholderiales bacterium]|nr:hypothetical protein [Burkholderiales bacterium]